MNHQASSVSHDIAAEQQDLTPHARVSLALWGWSVAMYVSLLWLCWPSLWFQPISLQDQARIAAFAPLSVFEALSYTAGGLFRPGDNLFFWLVAHSSALWPIRAGLLGVFLLLTALTQLQSSQRGDNRLLGFGAAACFAVSPTVLSVVCWLSATHISLCALGIMGYIEFGSRAFDRDSGRARNVWLALGSLVFALSFDALAIMAVPMLALYQLWISSRRRDGLAKRLYAGSLACVAGYLVLQLTAANVWRFWAAESASSLVANSMRYSVHNLWLWFYPFDTFGATIPDTAGDHTLENVLCWLFVISAVIVTLKLRRADPISVYGCIWLSMFMVPAGSILRFDADPIAPQHVLIPMLGLGLAGMRVVSRLLERLSASIARKPVRLLVEVCISVFLLWSLAPLVAECHRTVRLWGNERQLYVATLTNYPNNTDVLVRLTTDYLTHAPAPDLEREDSDSPDESVLGALLMLPPRPKPADLLRTGHELMRSAHYVEAGSAFARVLTASASASQHVDAGKTLVIALRQADQRALAQSLLDRLRHDYPTHAELASIEHQG